MTPMLETLNIIGKKSFSFMCYQEKTGALRTTFFFKTKQDWLPNGCDATFKVQEAVSKI